MCLLSFEFGVRYRDNGDDCFSPSAKKRRKLIQNENKNENENFTKTPRVIRKICGNICSITAKRKPRKKRKYYKNENKNKNKNKAVSTAQPIATTTKLQQCNKNINSINKIFH